MKTSRQIIPLLIIGAVFYYIVKGGDDSSEYSESSSDNRSSKQNTLEAYSKRGIANTWPQIDEGFTEVADDLTAKNYYLVVDGSGSMADTGCGEGREKLDVAKDALKLFIRKLPQDAGLGVHAFDARGIGERIAIAKQNFSAAEREIDALQAGGGTPLSMAVEQGYEALTEQAKKQLGYGEYNLVIVTDGEANSGYEPDDEVDFLLQNSPITVHTVGFCINENHSLNQPGYTIYKSANNPEALSAGLEDVLSEAPDFDSSEFEGNEG